MESCINLDLVFDWMRQNAGGKKSAFSVVTVLCEWTLCSLEFSCFVQLLRPTTISCVFRFVFVVLLTSWKIFRFPRFAGNYFSLVMTQKVGVKIPAQNKRSP